MAMTAMPRGCLIMRQGETVNPYLNHCKSAKKSVYTLRCDKFVMYIYICIHHYICIYIYIYIYIYVGLSWYDYLWFSLLVSYSYPIIPAKESPTAPDTSPKGEVRSEGVVQGGRGLRAGHQSWSRNLCGSSKSDSFTVIAMVIAIVYN